MRNEDEGLRNSFGRWRGQAFDGRWRAPPATHNRMRHSASDDYEAWESKVPESVSFDRLWMVSAYRLALYARRKAWPDAMTVARHRIGEPVARQLYRSVASIAANVAEGWSRTTGPERARFFEYALGSAREAIVWYQAAAPVLKSELTQLRLNRLAEVRRLLLAMIQSERRRHGRVTKRPE